MENLRKKMKIDQVPLISKVLDFNASMSSTQSRNLLDMPDEVIEMIIDNLNYFDQERFSMCSKKINEIYQSRTKNVWLKIQDPQEAIDLTRPYGKVIWQCDKVPEVKEEVWSHLAPSMKALIVRGIGLNDYRANSGCFMAALPYFGNLVHWELVSNNWFVEYLRKIFPVESVSQVVEMGKLEHLEINASLFLILNGRFVKFSTKKLKTLIMNIDKLGSQQESEDLISFMTRQTKLEILRLKGRNVSSFFNQRYLVNVQMKEIELTTTFWDLRDDQQDNFVYFLESQKHAELRNYKVILEYPKTQSLLNFHMSQLDLPINSMKFTIVGNEQRCIESAALEYNYLEFLQFPHRVNLATENLDVTLEQGTLNHYFLSRLCSKFPNLKELKLNVKADWKAFGPMGLRALLTLGSLENFNFNYCYSSHCQQEIFSEVTIPKLKKFAYCPKIISNSNSMDLNNFLARHKNITHLKLTLYYQPSYDKRQFYPSHHTGHAPVLKYAMETLKELEFVEASWWQDSETFDDLRQTMIMYAYPGLVMQLVQFDGVTLTLTKVDASNVTVTTNGAG